MKIHYSAWGLKGVCGSYPPSSRYLTRYSPMYVTCKSCLRIITKRGIVSIQMMEKEKDLLVKDMIELGHSLEKAIKAGDLDASITSLEEMNLNISEQKRINEMLDEMRKL